MTLTPAEKRILELILAGQRHKEIARNINLSESTVKFHAGNVYAKHGVNSREELIRLKQSGGSKLEWDKLVDVEKRIGVLSVDHTREEVAAILKVSESEIGYRLRVIYGILRVKGRVGLAAYMGRHGLLDMPAEVVEMPAVRKSA
jgi:DNA-binding CsgD family transcriptional regulator